MITGTMKADALTIGAITIDFLTANPKIHAKAALIVRGEAQRVVGFTEGHGELWTAETLRKITELLECMEKDMARVLFVSDAAPTVGAVKAEPGGIGEFLKDPPQI